MRLLSKNAKPNNRVFGISFGLDICWLGPKENIGRRESATRFEKKKQRLFVVYGRCRRVPAESLDRVGLEDAVEGRMKFLVAKGAEF